MSTSSADQAEIHLVFSYTLQKTPTLSARGTLMRNAKVDFRLKLDIAHVLPNGAPKPQALWFAECHALKIVSEHITPDVRLLNWQLRLNGRDEVLSEFQILVPSDQI